jgi:hypothetical protein
VKPVQRNRFVIPALSIASIIVLGLSAAGQDAGHDAAQSDESGDNCIIYGMACSIGCTTYSSATTLPTGTGRYISYKEDAGEACTHCWLGYNGGVCIESTLYPPVQCGTEYCYPFAGCVGTPVVYGHLVNIANSGPDCGFGSKQVPWA